jgi:hypothetical protein
MGFENDRGEQADAKDKIRVYDLSGNMFNGSEYSRIEIPDNKRKVGK